jgi:hypothetical protein
MLNVLMGLHPLFYGCRLARKKPLEAVGKRILIGRFFNPFARTFCGAANHLFHIKSFWYPLENEWC